MEPATAVSAPLLAPPPASPPDADASKPNCPSEKPPSAVGGIFIEARRIMKLSVKGLLHFPQGENTCEKFYS